MSWLLLLTLACGEKEADTGSSEEETVEAVDTSSEGSEEETGESSEEAE